MTADKSGDHASKRSARRGALSCAECRRLKLRCDRQFPCQSCRKRGCAAICPDGALTTGKGNRFILANTEELHNKISELQDRIISLEEALSSLQATVSNEPHPLLREDLLRIKASITATTAAPEASTSTGESKAGVSVKLPKLVAKPPTGNDSAEEEGPEVLSAFGTLKIDDQGKSRYFGSLAGAQLLLGSDESDDEAPCDPRAPPPALRPMENLLPNEVAKLAHTYPFAMNPCDYEGTRRQLEGLLPPAAKAWSITQKYYEYSTWQFNCVPRQWFTDRVLVPLYEPQRNADQAPEHQLALVYMVFALGTLIDLDLPPFHPDAEHYHQLARAALALDSQGTSIMAVQALILMAYFNQLTDKKNGPGLSWMVMGIAVKMGTGIGLHRDPKRWKMDPEQTDLRRMVFWELACFDAWQAQGFGRPPMITFEHVDTALPIDWEERVNAAGQVESSFYRLKYTYTELLLSTLNTAFGAQRPTYETILRLDRRIRDFHVPDHMRVPGLQEMDHVVPNDTEPPTLHLTMQRHLLFFVKEITLLYLHRSFFARALTEQPGDPFKSRYAASVLACYRSSSGVLAGIRNAYQLHPGLVPRFYMFWTHAFSSAIVLAAIVTRSPGCNLAYRALGELDAAYTMFKAASELQGSRATKALPVLYKVRQRAHYYYTEYRAGRMVVSPHVHAQPSQEEEEDQAMLGNTTRLIATRKAKMMSASPSVSDAAADSPPSYTDDSVHPALVQYLKAYNNSLEQQELSTVSQAQHSTGSQVDQQNQHPYLYQFPTALYTTPEVPQESLFTFQLQASPEPAMPFYPPIHDPRSLSAHYNPAPVFGPPQTANTMPAVPASPYQRDAAISTTPGTGELDVAWTNFMAELVGMSQ